VGNLDRQDIERRGTTPAFRVFARHAFVRSALVELSGTDHQHLGGTEMLALAGTGYGLIGILVIILLVVLIIYFVRRA
jgi:hypothetical protein